MEQAQALAIVKSLANGVDPDSGEVFPGDGAYQRPQTVRALFAAVEALERAAQFERRKQQLPAKTGEPWSEDEDRKLPRRSTRGTRSASWRRRTSARRRASARGW